MYIQEGDKDTRWAVYGLKRRRTTEIRYVGLTTMTVSQRAAGHVSAARQGGSYAVSRWLHKHRLSVELVVLATVNEGDLTNLAFLEQYWIATLRTSGHRLLNLTDGGEGPNGVKFSDTERASRSERIMGERNPNYGKFGADHPSYGRVLSAETRETLAEAKRGVKNPNYGKVMTDSEKQARRDKQLGVPNPGARISAHTRHHTNKGVVSAKCSYCTI